MDTESMLREIINYINNDRLNYALLINGQWGTGKTFFIKNKLFPLLLSDIPSEKCIQPLKSIFFSKKIKKKNYQKNQFIFLSMELNQLMIYQFKYIYNYLVNYLNFFLWELA